MDAVEYLKALHRMCIKNNSCEACPTYKGVGTKCSLPYRSDEALEERVKIVDEWAKEHPVRTRKSVFLVQYPNAMTLDDGTPNICPRDVDKTIMQRCEGLCDTCKIEYWSQEVTDESKG